MNTQSRFRLVGGVVSSLILFVSLVSLPLARKGWTTAAMIPVNENTFEFTNDEAEDAYDLHIKWSRAVEVKGSEPFKKVDGSGKSSTDLSNGVVKKGGAKASVKVAWDGSDPKVKEWWWTKANGDRLGEVKEGNPTTASAPITPSSTTGDGLRIVTFDTLQSRVIVNLPDDMMAGDTISGTVIAEPKGQTPEERANNQVKSRDYVVALRPIVDPKSHTPTPPIVIFDLSKGLAQPNGSSKVTETFVAPTKVNVGLFMMPNENAPIGACGRSGSLVAINESCSPISQLVFTSPDQGITVTPSPTIPPIFTIPILGQTGRPIVITGPFDGNSSNTSLNSATAKSTVQDFEKSTENVSGGFGLIRPLAESPRKAVFEAPTNVTGPLNMTLKEVNVETKGQYRNVGINLTAPKTNLLKGEQTELKVEVNGLEGLKQPVPLTITYRGVIVMEGGPYQPLIIQPSQVSSDGRYTTTRGITGVQTGGWTATATVVTHKFDFCLQDDSNPARVILWNTFTGDYNFICPGCLPASGGTKTGETKQPGGTTTTVAPTGTPGIIFPPPTGLSGTGTMIRKGCIITLTDNRPDRRVMSRLDVCTNSGSSTVEVPKTDKKFTITDRNTADNTCACGPGCR